MAEAPDKAVYLLTGSDRPKIETALARLRRHFAAEATDVVDALETSGEETVALCNTGSLLGDVRLVIAESVDGVRDSQNRLKGGWKTADVEAVAGYLASPAPGTVLALVGDDVKKSTALYKACAKAGQVLEYAVEKKKIQGWVAEQFRQRGVDAEPEACAALVHIVGEDLHALATEVDKIATWAAGEPVGEAEVEALAAPAGDTPIYALTDAWAARDAGRALGLSETIFEREAKPRRDTAPRIAGGLAGHLTRLRSVARLSEDGVSPADAAGKLRLNPYFVRKLFQQVGTFSREELRDASIRLAELDGALKGQSKLAPDLEVQRTIVDLTRRPGAPSRPP